VLLDQFRNDFPVGSDGIDGGLVIITHQFAVALDISTEDSRQFALRIIFSQGAPLCYFDFRLLK
jgi:hypothetical protein